MPVSPGAALNELPYQLKRTEQPKTYDLNMEHGVWVKVIPLPAKWRLVPQHSHNFPHVTNLVRGAIRVWKDGTLDADYRAPCGILIEAGVKHTFLTLEDDTVLLCVHDARTLEAMIESEHQFEGIG